LHLIGEVNSEFYEKVLNGRLGIKLHGTMSQSSIHSFLANCDVGLAVDIPLNLNRKLALTNKIIAYTQAGLHVLATNTPAHLMFLDNIEEYSLINSDMSNINKTLISLLNNIYQLRSNILKKYALANIYKWELESIKLINAWT
jgi:hypothetical protein